MRSAIFYLILGLINLSLGMGFSIQSEEQGAIEDFRLLQNATDSPTSSPTVSPTSSPTASPTDSPTSSPTSSPTTSPTSSPTSSPTISPTGSPTGSPTNSPTRSPTNSPTAAPTLSPITSAPTNNPTNSPTDSPTTSPTTSPTRSPTASPTASPTFSPVTSAPTRSPTVNPTKSPTTSPTDNPTQSPTTSPTVNPTENPTANPTNNPTETFAPTDSPTVSPTENPTQNPTVSPTKNPTESPTDNPTRQPTVSPTQNPTKNPTFPTVSPAAAADGNIGMIIGVAIPIFLILILVGVLFVYRDRVPFLAGGATQNNEIDEKKKAIAVIDEGSIGTEGSIGKGTPQTAAEPKTPDNPTFRNSGEVAAAIPIVASTPKKDDPYTLGMNSTTGLVGPGQVANVNVLLGKASNVVEEKTKKVKTKLGVKEKKHIGENYDPVKEDIKAGIDINVLSSGAANNNVQAKKDAKVNAMMKKAKAQGVDEDIAMLDALVAANTNKPAEQDDDVAMLDALVAAHTPGLRSTPPESSDKNGVRGRATTDNPAFGTGRPQSDYIENLDEKHKSIFRPSSWFLKSVKGAKNETSSIKSKKSKNMGKKDIDSDI